MPWRLAKLWLGWNAAAVAAGWILSLAGLLNRTSYAVLAGVGLVAAGVFLYRQPARPASCPARWRRRWTRLPAATFLVLVGAALLGGALYAPNNIDALAYRTPRVLHWLAEERWHWIPAPYQRLNTRACGFEWATAPFLSLLQSDRPLFLLNVAAFCLLPGFVFSSLRNLGVGGRAAATWMWLFPGGYCFALQAGSIGNDLHGATLSAAALAFALRARRHHHPSDAAWSIIAAGLMTGAKSSNLPLLLPWAAVLLPTVPTLLRSPLLVGTACILGLAGSIVPISALNIRYAGDWTGLKAEDAWIRPPGPIACALHNAGLMATQNLLPPILPGAGAVNAAVQKALPESWKSKVDGFAENGRDAYAVRELPGEEHAGLGFGVTWLAILTVLHGLQRGGLKSLFTPGDRLRPWLLLLPFVALGPYLAKSGITTAGRILAPYYPWLLPGLLVAGSASTALRTRWFRFGSGIACLLVLTLVVLLPTRPLWPAQTVLAALAKRSPSRAIERAQTVYEVYARRADVFEPLRPLIPVDSPWIGFVTINDAETSLWKPYGHHRVRHLLTTDRLDDLRQLGMRCLVANAEDFAARFRQPIEEWAAGNGGRIAGRRPIKLLAREPARDFVVIVW